MKNRIYAILFALIAALCVWLMGVMIHYSHLVPAVTFGLLAGLAAGLVIHYTQGAE